VSIERQIRALLRVAEEYQAERCNALLDAANRKSRHILQHAHAAARSRLREALSDQRERLDAAIAEAETELVTQLRVSAQKRLTAALTLSLPGLKQALHRQWASRSGRSRWVEQHLKVARSVLPPTGWTIVHPPDWPQDEREDVRGWLQALGIDHPRFESDAALSAGIRVTCGPNLLDASLDGLLADRPLIEGRLLHYLQQEAL
jgi:hypothetical protein